MFAGLIAGIAGFISSLGASAAASAAIAGGIVQIGASVLFSTVAGLFRPTGDSQQQTKLQLSQPTSKPAYRYVYGTDLAVGTRCPVRVRGSKIYGCWLLNSRPSFMGTASYFFDKREVTYTGNPYDFTEGGGAFVDSGPLAGYVRFWVGRGDQTTPPFEITDEAPRGPGVDDELFDVTDGWQGRTVLWAILDAGPADEITERWFTAPPLVEVLAFWSKVWDPREVNQDPDDPSTWGPSDNHALVCLDMAMRNKIRPFRLADLNIDQFIAAANVADEPVALKGGGTEPRYRVSGTVVWDTEELWSKLGAIYSAGAANPTGDNGVLGIAPGAYEAPSYTLTDMLDGDWRFQTLRSGDKVTQLRTTYTNPERFYEPSSLEPYDIPGALEAAGGVPRHRDLNLEYAGSPTQAMRVQKIEGERIRREKTITLTAPPDAANLIGGSTMTSALPAPYAPMNGLYQITSIDPQAIVGTMIGGGKVSLACPLIAVEYHADIFAYDAATEEQDILVASFNPNPDGVSVTIDNPTELAAAESVTTPGTIRISAKTPDDPYLKQMEWLVSTTSDLNDATLLIRVPVSRNLSYTQSDVVGSGQTRYYWVRALGNFGSASAYVGPVSATTA